MIAEYIELNQLIVFDKKFKLFSFPIRKSLEKSHLNVTKHNLYNKIEKITKK